MARTSTRAEMRDRTYRYADLEGATQRFPNSEVNDYLDEAVAETYTLLVRARGSGFYETTGSPITTTASVDPYALSASFFQLLKVSITANGRTTELTPHNIHQEDDSTWLDSQQRGVPTTYRLQGDNLSLRPIPDGTYTINYKFIPAPAKFVNDSSTFDGIAGFEKHAELLAAKRMSIKEADWDRVAILNQEITKEEERILAVAGFRDASLPRTIVDVRGLERRNRYRRYF